MHYLYLDTETFYQPAAGITLQKMTLRNYFAAIADQPNKGLTGLGFAIDDGEVEYFHGRPGPDFIEFLESCARSDDWAFVAHNAAFDIRVLRFVLDIPQPRTVHCSLELSAGAWPNQPGGYSLRSLALALGLPPKLDVDLTQGGATDAEIETYCKHDVWLCREIHQRAVAGLPPEEVRIQEMAQAVRELSLSIDGSAVAEAITGFNATSSLEAAGAAEALGLPLGKADAFGVNDDGTLRSVKPAALKNALLEICGYDAQSISIKKNNPARLAANPSAARVLHASARANKALSHRRRVAVFSGVRTVDVELSYHSAHTGRYSSKMSANSSGKAAKGVNLHNLPKRNKTVAKLIRRVFRSDSGHCWVSGDLANAEYRMEGWLCKSKYIKELYERNIFEDPYSRFGETATGTRVDKSMPIRQIWKNCVLGLGFHMGTQRWISELLLVLADFEQNKVRLEDLAALCRDNDWTPVSDGRARAAGEKLGAPWEVVAVAYHTRRLFHEIHPEFKIVADWILGTLKEVSCALDPEAAIDAAYRLPSAPDRDRINLVYAPGIGPGRTVRVGCGGWPPTVTWRDLGIHDTKFGPAFSSLQGGDKGYRALSPSIVIENVTQAAARNALVRGKLRLDELGYRQILSIHDEAKLWTVRTPDGVLAAADSLMRVYGPGNDLGYGWAVVMNPAEVTVTESLWETELGPEFWDALSKGDASPLQSLA